MVKDCDDVLETDGDGDPVMRLGVKVGGGVWLGVPEADAVPFVGEPLNEGVKVGGGVMVGVVVAVATEMLALLESAIVPVGQLADTDIVAAEREGVQVIDFVPRAGGVRLKK